jgi:hypothetical protein
MIRERCEATMRASRAEVARALYNDVSVFAAARLGALTVPEH